MRNGFSASQSLPRSHAFPTYQCRPRLNGFFACQGVTAFPVKMLWCGFSACQSQPRTHGFSGCHYQPRWLRLSAWQYLTRRHSLLYLLVKDSWPLYSPVLARMSVAVTDLRCRAVLWVTEALIHQRHGLINHPYAGNHRLSFSWERNA